MRKRFTSNEIRLARSAFRRAWKKIHHMDSWGVEVAYKKSLMKAFTEELSLMEKKMTSYPLLAIGKCMVK